MDLEAREPTITTPPNCLWDPNWIHVKEQCWINECRNRVRRSPATWRWGSKQMCSSMKSCGPSEWDRNLGKIECEFSLYDTRRWKWDDVYLLKGLPNIYSPSLCPLSLPLYLSTPAIAPQTCTWRLWSSKIGDALGGHDRANLEALIERVMTYPWSLWLSEFGCTWRP
jgi:hypothetical protein